MLRLHSAIPNDSDLLAQMNKRLIEDEQSANAMSVAQLRERIEGWLSADYQAIIFEQPEGVVGYALYRFQDETFREQQIYLRQFYIEKSYRRQGLGREAFSHLKQNYFRDAHVTLETLTTNPNGLAFWQRLGFQPYAVTMKLR